MSPGPSSRAIASHCRNTRLVLFSSLLGDVSDATEEF